MGLGHLKSLLAILGFEGVETHAPEGGHGHASDDVLVVHHEDGPLPSELRGTKRGLPGHFR